MRLKAIPGQEPPTRLYLIRHGQVADGHTHLYHGHNDIHLSPKGVAQLEKLARQLKAAPLTAVYSSDLTRSLEGARVLCRGRGLEPVIVPEFREINFGVWEGLSFEEIAAKYPEELNARFQDLANFRIPGGESLMDVRARALPRLGELIEQHQGQALAVVAHAGVNRVVLSDALGAPFNNLFRIDQSYGCLNIIDYFPDLAVVRLINGGVNGVV
ncbi:MAG: histidine phosphatase family protein [Deltaproteobacteria bacterium]|nr:histidine phosphatase family protein [Deltaproteobacteria bacterium]